MFIYVTPCIFLFANTGVRAWSVNCCWSDILSAIYYTLTLTAIPNMVGFTYTLINIVWLESRGCWGTLSTCSNTNYNLIWECMQFISINTLTKINILFNQRISISRTVISTIFRESGVLIVKISIITFTNLFCIIINKIINTKAWITVIWVRAIGIFYLVTMNITYSCILIISKYCSATHALSICWWIF